MLALLREDDVDAAIEAGLARFIPLAALDDEDNAALVAARDRLLAAWAARERHRARAQRLERVAAGRRRARTAARPVDTSTTGATDGAGGQAADVPSRPALPAAAAAALARARARAAGRRS